MEYRELTTNEMTYANEQNDFDIIGRTGALCTIKTNISSSAEDVSIKYTYGIVPKSETANAEIKAFVEGLKDNTDLSKASTFRIDLAETAFLGKIDSGNISCCCYKRECLDRHIENASKGIRFIDTGYNTLFYIPDNSDIILTDWNGVESKLNCRYIDPYHLSVNGNCYHICQFAEFLERNNASCRPYTNDEVKSVATDTKKKKDNYER